MNKTTITIIILLAAGTAAFLLFGGKSAKAPKSPVNGDSVLVPGGKAFVERLELSRLESFPVRINVKVSGSLSDACTQVKEVTQAREGNTFTLKVKTLRPKDTVCAQMLTQFEKTIELDVFALPAGEYTVVAGDKSSFFTLDKDNVIEDKG